MAYTKNFNRQKYDIKDIKSICKKARYSKSLVEVEILLIFRIKLGFQILAVLKKQIKFQVFFN